MIRLRIYLSDGPTPTSVSIRFVNDSADSVIVVAPDPYVSIGVTDCNGQPYLRNRAVVWDNSRKTCLITPGGTVVATINLDHYFDDIDGDVMVHARIEVINSAGVSEEHAVEGKAHLNIQSIDEKIATLKATPRQRGLPCKRFDVSDGTIFAHVSSTPT